MDFKGIFGLMCIVALTILSLGVTLWLIQLGFAIIYLLFAVVIYLLPYALAFTLAVVVTMAVLAAIRTRGK